jgi:hypothetical protein
MTRLLFSRRAIRRLVVATLVAIGVQTALVLTPANALTPGWFQFDRKSNANSNLFWMWGDSSDQLHWIYYRGGSGVSTDECWISHGWLPGGWYDMWGMWDNYNGGQIFGRVFRLSDHTCKNGSTRRTALFIHTEETPSQGQNCGSEPQCWDGAGDYYSAGCIKVSYPNHGFPNDIGNIHWQFHNNGGSRSHGSYTLQYMLYVT